MSDKQVPSLEELVKQTKKRYEDEQKQLSDANYNAIFVAFVRFYSQQNFSAEYSVCADVLGCLNGSESDQVLARAWLNEFPEKMENFYEKLKANRTDFNQQFRKNIERYEQEFSRLLCGTHESSEGKSSTSLSSALTNSAKGNQKVFEEKVEFISNNYKIVRSEEILTEFYEKIFQEKLNELEEFTRKVLEKNLENATVFMKEKITTVELLETKIRLLETSIRSGRSSQLSSNKENHTGESGFTEQRYKELVIENDQLEKEYESLMKQNKLLSTLDQNKVEEYLQLHREHEYIANLGNGSNSNLSLSVRSDRSRSIPSRFSSTPFNSLLNRSSLNFSTNSISFSFDEISKKIEQISLETSPVFEDNTK